MTETKSADSQSLAENRTLARLLDETADLLESQDANPYRVRAYRNTAADIRSAPRGLREVWEAGGREALARLRGIGESLSKAIETWFLSGALGILVRLRGEEAAERILRTIPGLGRKLASRIHHDLGVSSLEELEQAAHDGRLEGVRGIGPRRLRAIQDQLDARLRRKGARSPGAGATAKGPAVEELLDVDREYRERGEAGLLRRIAPRRFNPRREAWLPVLHTQRGRRHYTALYSNTALAHKLRRTRDWVVIHLDDGAGERQWTVVTENRGPLAGRRVVRGREVECLELWSGAGAP